MRLIHSDLCGPMQTATPQGNKYFLMLIDDYSRFIVVRLLKSKDEVSQAVQDYIAMALTRFNKKPAILRTDNGKEYITCDLENFLRKEGIQHQLTVTYTPQQNGVAERKNRTLTESAKCMLLDASLDNRFWGKAILTAAYLQNRIIGRNIEKTPLELFTGQKPDMSYIRVFGSKVFSLIPKQRRRKWDDKAEEGVLVGYDGNTKGYRILDPKTNKIWISRTVQIIETHDQHTGHGLQPRKEMPDDIHATTVQESTRREVEVDCEEAEKDDDRNTPEEQTEDSDNDAWSTPEIRVTSGR